MMAKGGGRLLVDPGFTIICTMLDASTLDYECFQGEATMLDTGILGKVLGKFQVMTFAQQVALLWGIILIGLLYLGLMAGVVHLISKKEWVTLFLLLILIAYFLLVSAGGETNYRFRAPIQPFLAILSGAGYGAMFNYISMYKNRNGTKSVTA